MSRSNKESIKQSLGFVKISIFASEISFIGKLPALTLQKTTEKKYLRYYIMITGKMFNFVVNTGINRRR